MLRLAELEHKLVDVNKASAQDAVSTIHPQAKFASRPLAVIGKVVPARCGRPGGSRCGPLLPASTELFRARESAFVEEVHERERERGNYEKRQNLVETGRGAACDEPQQNTCCVQHNADSPPRI